MISSSGRSGREASLSFPPPRIPVVGTHARIVQHPVGDALPEDIVTHAHDSLVQDIIGRVAVGIAAETSGSCACGLGIGPRLSCTGTAGIADTATPAAARGSWRAGRWHFLASHRTTLIISTAAA